MIVRAVIQASYQFSNFDYFNNYYDTISWLRALIRISADIQVVARAFEVSKLLEEGYDAFLQQALPPFSE